MTAINILKPHLAINVRNVENSIEFYKKMFGIEPSKVRTGYAKFDVQSPALNFTLNQVAFDGPGALSHLGIQVGSTNDVNAMKADWIARGLDPKDELQTDCCFALQDKAWVHDPDGNEWEVFTVIKDNLPEVSERTTGCCVPTAETDVVLDVTCACETSTPAEGEGACCDTQANKFNIEVKAGSTCCA
jgi:catechol 2,3-dioxygenase-like lactoylglutathione lyase family enzyme